MREKGTLSEGRLSDGQLSEQIRKETTRDDRIRLAVLHEIAGFSFQKIVDELKLDINKSTCRRIYNRMKEDGTTSNRKRTGRPTFFDKDKRNELDQFITQDKRTRRLPWEMVRNEMAMKCSVRTLRQKAHRLGFHKRRRRKKIGLRAESPSKRLKWAREHLHWTNEEWSRLIWTDESSFSTAGFGQQPPVTRKDGEEETYNADCLNQTWRSGRQSVMVWGAFCGEEKSELHFVPTNTSVNSSSYTLSILDPILIPFWHEMCERDGWTAVVEDNAPGHKKYASRCQEKNNLDSIDWPPQSPDLNLIENFWNDMNEYVGRIYGRVTTLSRLKEVLQEAWDDIGKERMRSLIECMPRRLWVVIEAQGGTTKY